MELEEVTKLAKKQIKFEKDLAEAEKQLKIATQNLKQVQEIDLPEAMREVGLKKITLETGETITIKDDFICGIPVAKRNEAFNWLESHKFGGLIRTEISISFGKGELEKAQKLQAKLSKEGAVLERTVHWQTLKAFINEQVGDGNDIPLDLFGAIPISKSTVK